MSVCGTAVAMGFRINPAHGRHRGFFLLRMCENTGEPGDHEYGVRQLWWETLFRKKSPPLRRQY